MCGIDVGNQYRVADFVEATLGRIHGVVGSRVLSSLEEDSGTEMAQDIPRTTYLPEVEEDARKERERRTVQEGTATWKRRKEELQRQKHREQRELQQLLKNYSPWGKPGGGAPCAATLRKKNVPLEPLELSKCHDFGQGWTSDSTIERLHGRNVNPLPVTDMNKFFDDRPEGVATGMQLAKSYSKNPYNEEVQVYELTGGVELVPLLTTRRYCSRSKGARHIATDATRPGCTIDSLRTLEVGNREYIAELCDQMRRKEEKALEERRMEQESCRRHFDTWRKLWGRPGHGAPIDHAHRNNLYNILYRPAIY
ncbi:uncharacterized protein LOC107995336 isoform X2 [Apis cerana]|uniref:uncharacterized protein LOC107995336 isoform X2 n=1 Tax=Apis cerana TaxID=7461 RepID=UPI002B2389AA|nr:uncharacterized protein LOC107995336 isoform X2 [Apis cerana]XP_028521281.2 uncharacterized protein LOC107995336 isoform X2 [Apis cerana]XP_061934253.1 uncharacterized protein LOC107995336 isoform X2 [Apis cerana]